MLPLDLLNEHCFGNFSFPDWIYLTVCGTLTICLLRPPTPAAPHFLLNLCRWVVLSLPRSPQSLVRKKSKLAHSGRHRGIISEAIITFRRSAAVVQSPCQASPPQPSSDCPLRALTSSALKFRGDTLVPLCECFNRTDSRNSNSLNNGKQIEEPPPISHSLRCKLPNPQGTKSTKS